MQWNELENVCTAKKVILYGLGLGIRQFMECYGNTIAVEAIIDNDVAKKGKKAGDLLSEAFQTKCEDLCISSADILAKYVPKDTVILVASAMCYREIVQELMEKKFELVYVLSLLDGVMHKQDWQQRVIQLRHDYMQACMEKPVAPNKVLFSSFANYADHEKYISEALIRLRPDLDIVWLVDDLDAELPDNVRKVWRANWKKVLYEAETAKMWIADTAISEFFLKRPEQVYIQTKHWASITLKKFYLDAAAFQNEPAKLAIWRRESDVIDYIIVGSEFDKESCKRGFGINKGFIMAGSPRSDGLFRVTENKEKVYTHYGLATDVHILLYAPTYRFSKENGKGVHQSREIGFDYRQVRTVLEMRFGGRWLIALRLHPSVCNAVKEMELPDFVFDVSTYEDSEELVSAFDITISDYSSLMFEPAFIRKPVFLYAVDLEDYIVKEYELLINYNELPFDVAKNTEQLCENILQFDPNEYELRVNRFLEQYGIREDGYASERVAGFIADLFHEL